MTAGGGHGHFAPAQNQADSLEPGTVPERWSWRVWVGFALAFVPLIAAVVFAIVRSS